jgi:putative transposase
MTHPLRIEYPGAVYHITSRGNDKNPLFKDDQDRETFLNALGHLMTNRYHFLIETLDGNL